MWLCYGFNWLHNSLYRLCRQVIQVSALFAVEVPDSAPDTEIASENCHPHRTCFPSNPIDSCYVVKGTEAKAQCDPL